MRYKFPPSVPCRHEPFDWLLAAIATVIAGVVCGILAQHGILP